jgi:hypothetical protein
MNWLPTVHRCAASIIILAGAASAAGQCASGEGADAARVVLRGVHFVPNQGQWADGSIRYGFKGRGVDIAFRDSALTMHLSRECTPEAVPGLSATERGGVTREALALDVTFPGSNAAAPVGAGALGSRFSYFLGGQECRWRRDVGSFGAVVYENLYDGIDLHVTGADAGLLKYEFRCAPGADHTRVRIRYGGVGSLRVSEAGDLLIDTDLGTILDSAPRVWQDIDGQRRTLVARFEALDARTYTIRLLTAPDPCHPVVIDPEVEWMTYLGGGGVDWGFDVALQDSGAVLVSGHTASGDFDGARNSYNGGDSDAFVARIDASGTIEWMTYLGGGSFDLGRGMALDGAGNALLTGWTNSDDFAGANNSFHGGSLDAFVARVGPTGTLDWMTYLGGTADDLGFGLAVDGTGAALVTGQAYSVDFAGANNSHHGGAYDAFAARVHPTGAIDWMTYLGGNDQDDASGIAADAAGAAFVVGDTWSPNFEGRINSPLGSRDVFVARIHGSGAIDRMTYLGGSGNEAGYGIALDAQGAALATGATVSLNFLGRNNQHHGGSSAIDGFLARVGPSGAVEWMTYLGGSGEEAALRVATDAAGAALVSGTTESADFEGRDNAFYGVFDAYVARVPAPGMIEWMSYVGGVGDDGGFGIAISADGNPLLTGRTNSIDFAGKNNMFHGGESWGDAFLLELGVAATCYPDLDGNGVLDLFDFLEFVNMFNAADPVADCDHSGVLDLFDFLCFVNGFDAGC